MIFTLEIHPAGRESAKRETHESESRFAMIRHARATAIALRDRLGWRGAIDFGDWREMFADGQLTRTMQFKIGDVVVATLSFSEPAKYSQFYYAARERHLAIRSAADAEQVQ